MTVIDTSKVESAKIGDTVRISIDLPVVASPLSSYGLGVQAGVLIINAEDILALARKVKIVDTAPEAPEVPAAPARQQFLNGQLYKAAGYVGRYNADADEFEAILSGGSPIFGTYFSGDQAAENGAELVTV